ncbi:MAG: RNA methyltransferase [Nitrospirota bacterium]
MNLYIALIHYPVRNKNGEIVSTAITNLDLHDMARVAKTYGVARFYIINPMAAQRELAGRIIRHWTEGFGAGYNPNRGEALRVIKVVPEFADALSEIEGETGARPKVIATAARERDAGGGVVSFGEARDIVNACPSVIAFGTGWGLTEDFIAACDYRLSPIRGAGDYNHLPVRSATAIILDRLVGER